MNDLVNFLMNTYGQEEIEEEMDLRKELFWSGIRASLYKKVHNEKDCYHQWAFITGKKSRYPDGSKITLSKKNINHFERTVGYLNSEEGQDNMHLYGIFEDSPEDVDSLMEFVSGAMIDRKIKKEIFNLFIKHRDRILDFLSSR
jgi:hypothetical protein